MWCPERDLGECSHTQARTHSLARSLASKQEFSNLKNIVTKSKLLLELPKARLSRDAIMTLCCVSDTSTWSSASWRRLSRGRLLFALRMGWLAGTGNGETASGYQKRQADNKSSAMAAGKEEEKLS